MQADPMINDLDRARALPARYYAGEAMLAMEQRAVFARSWQLVAHQGQLTEPGDHAVGQVAEVPVLLVRGHDGVLRAFPNVCRHRAGPLALCDGKGIRALHCKYHGWTYTLEGQLRSAPEMQDACDFKVEDIHLPPLRVQEWQGLVFVALDAQTPAFDEVYGGIVERIAPIDLSTMRYLRRDTYDIACNWKVTSTTSSRATTCRTCIRACRRCSTTASTTPSCSRGTRCSPRRCATAARCTATARRSTTSSTPT
jgi:Phenylpropionate dioxygenase and related ring-hydroxylating dioxygenases, large terminal subunit